MLVKITREDVKTFAYGEYILKCKGQKLNFDMKDADLYTEGYLSCHDKMKSFNAKAQFGYTGELRMPSGGEPITNQRVESGTALNGYAR